MDVPLAWNFNKELKMFLSAVRRSLISVGVSSTKNFLLKSLKKDAIKTFATVASKRTNSNPTKELIKTLESEIADQIETIKEEEMNPSTVLESFSEFLQKGNWKLEHPKDTLMVTLSRRDEKLQANIAVKFDLLQVYGELYDDGSESSLMNEEEEEGESENYENDQITDSNESIDDVEGLDYVSFPISVEIKRDNVAGKHLSFDCVLEGDDEQAEILIENVSILNTESANINSNSNAYTSPNFVQLDESLQENFQEFLGNMIGENQEELMSFVKEYVVAQEAEMYQKWLGQVRDILKQ